MLNTRLKSRTVLKWVFVLALIGFAVSMGRLIHSRLRAQEVRTGGPIPYTVILRETVYGPDGTATVAAEQTQAVRSDGSFVRRLAHKGENQATERTIKFASGIEVTINDVAKTKSTILRENISPARWHRDPNSKCINSLAGEPMISLPEVFSGEEMVAGYRTAKLTWNNITAWHALDCGCAEVKSRADWGKQGFSEWNLVGLIPGEPDAALFEVPATAREVPPSERVLGPGKSHENFGPGAAERHRKLDEYYYKHRPVQ
jgi:hypothetical protein